MMKFGGMEEDQELMKFVCKQCYKRYPCGKSLGGHMRSHVVANSAEMVDEKGGGGGGGGVDPTAMKRDHHHQQRFEHGGGYSSYGLRENPKKTWRAVDSTSPLPQEKACKQCGKVFQSLKALCGHMACHSEKERGGGVKDDQSWSSESKKLEEEDEEEEEVDDDDDDDDDDESDDVDDVDDSDTEPEEDQIPTTTTRDNNNNRSQSTHHPKRYKKLVVKSYSLSLTNNNSIGSSSVSEIDEQEQEEVAKCLMMLSKDSGNWYGSVVEFSDNNSVVLETKSSSIDMKTSRKNGNGNGNGKGVVYKVCNRDNNETQNPPTKKMGDNRKVMKSSIVHTEMAESQSSDSGYFLGENKVESDVSVNGFLAKCKVLNRVKGYVEPRRGGVEKEYENYDDFGVASNSGKQKRTNDTSYDPEMETGSYKKTKVVAASSPGTNANKKKYECLNCKKSFNSYQALGGHRPCHKKTNPDMESGYGTGENSLDADETYNHGNGGKIRDCFGSKKAGATEKKVRPKKGKGHECPFCHRMFKSGQALGGHKRSHFIGGAQVINGSHQTPAAAKEEAADLLDLNLPAPVEDEDDEQLMAW
ncbi:PREDICTED: MATH and LRR domain-containing protein PFE0570w-like [Ipomoea nil]|uniref:MATH and LRR domain-containing protein PFE0570w-like n=1 Tax=Ipomoea nil TaxID=35883 RepID=UPI000901B553|nr:PREDICTED: MATH and LRR domain-containing protein PFE0570w-like [Ipomoea nil]